MLARETGWGGNGFQRTRDMQVRSRRVLPGPSASTQPKQLGTRHAGRVWPVTFESHRCYMRKIQGESALSPKRDPRDAHLLVALATCLTPRIPGARILPLTALTPIPGDRSIPSPSFRSRRGRCVFRSYRFDVICTTTSRAPCGTEFVVMTPPGHRTTTARAGSGVASTWMALSWDQ